MAVLLCRGRWAVKIALSVAVGVVSISLAVARSPDLDGSGAIDLADLRVFIEQWRLREGAQWDHAADLNEDGRLNRADALLLLEALHTPAGAEELAETIEATGEQWLVVMKADPTAPDMAGFAQWLRARADIASAEVQEDLVAATKVSGVNLCFADLPWDVETGASVAGVPGPAPQASTQSVQTLPGPTAVRPAATQCLGDLVPKGTALLINALLTDAHDPRAKMRESLEHAGYTVVEKPGDLVDFLDLADASFTVVKSHGNTWTDAKAKKHYFIWSNILDEPNPTTIGRHMAPLMGGELLLGCAVRYDAQGKPVLARWALGIVDTWFANTLASVPNNAALVFITCHGADLDEPWKTFQAKGASAYFGFTNQVGNSWASTWGKRLVDRLTGANKFEPFDTQPPRRAQSFEDAFYFIRAHAGYVACPSHGGVPKMRYEYDGSGFSAAPHIGYAVLESLGGTAPYNELDLDGAFGLADDCQVLLGGHQLPVTSTSGGGGAPFTVQVPPDQSGDVHVKLADGRESNRVTVSHFDTTVQIDYAEPLGAYGAITLRYKEQTVGQRMYNALTQELCYGGWDERTVARPDVPYVLVQGYGDWQVEWDFNATRTIGDTTFTWVGNGQASGRGEPANDNKPSGMMMVTLSPASSAPGQTTCDAEIFVSADAGPIHWTAAGPGGTASGDTMIMFRSVPFHTGVYNQLTATLQAVAGAGLAGGTWQIPATQLDPAPAGLTRPVLTPRTILLERWALGPPWLLP